MSLKEMIGKMFAVGFDGLVANESIKKMIHEYKVGTVILFSRNISDAKQVKKLTKDLQDEAKRAGYITPLLICIDQENGTVRRINEAMTSFPGPMALAATGDSKNAHDAYEATAKELRALGVNWNLVPVLDVNSNPLNPIIGTRAFSDNPETVFSFGLESILGTNSGGCLSSVKHFPGHGDTSTDSHLEIPIVNKDYDELIISDLLPYKKLADLGKLETVMVSHIEFPMLDNKVASQSNKIVNGILRSDFGYNGLVVTDCMEMDAIDKSVGVIEGTINAINAGIDIIMISHTFNKQVDSIENLLREVENGNIKRERIEESYSRFLKIASNLHPASFVNDDYDFLSRRLYNESITVLKDDDNQNYNSVALLFPKNKIQLRVEDFSTTYNFDDSLIKISNEYNVYYYNEETTEKNFKDLSIDLDKYDKVIVCTVNMDIDDPIINGLDFKGKGWDWLILKNPYDLLLWNKDEFSRIICLYEPSNYLINHTINNYDDVSIFTGELPVKI